MKATPWMYVLGVAAIAAMLAAPLPAMAQGKGKRFALACIGTKTGSTINFAYRWGKSGEWTEASIRPGKWQLMMWNYDRANENRSPPLQVRYDDDMTDYDNFVVTDIEAYAASKQDCEGEGKTYHFIESGDELFLEEDD